MKYKILKKSVWVIVIILNIGLISGCNNFKFNIDEDKEKAKESKIINSINERKNDLSIHNLLLGNINLKLDDYLSRNLCVTKEDVVLDGFDLKGLSSSGLFDLTNLKVVQGYNLFDKIYPASTTKIMTALIAVESGKLDEEVTVDAESLNIPNISTKAGLRSGDKLKLKDLIYAMMLPSGNDAANVIAKFLSGNNDEFVKTMNDKAVKLGATHTNYTNPHGLHNDNHYTTVYDMYLIFNTVIQNDILKEIMSTPETTIHIIRNNKDYNMKLKNTNYYLIGKAKFPKGVNSISGKTGTTDEAGCCLITYLKDSNNKEYICAVMGVPKINSPNDHQALYNKMTKLIDIGLKQN